MSLSYPEELRDRVAKMIDDVGPLATVSAVGFQDADAERVRRALSLVQANRGWSFLDLREVEEEAAAAALSRSLGAPALILAIRPGRELGPVLGLVRACVDERPTVELDERTTAQRNTAQSVVLILDGCTRWAELGGVLAAIPYWDLRAGAGKERD